MLESGKLAPAENIRRTFLQNLKVAVKRAVTEITENEKDASSSGDKECKEEESGKGENAGDQSSSDQDSGERTRREGGGVLGSNFAGYMPLASQNPEFVILNVEHFTFYLQYEHSGTCANRKYMYLQTYRHK